MKFGVARVLTFGFLAFSLAFFFLYRPLSYRADLAEAIVTSVSAQVDEQSKIIAVGPQVAAADKALQLRLRALRAKCAPRCHDVLSTASEVAAMRAIARSAGVEITTRTFHTDGAIDVITLSSQAGALRFLDGLQRMPTPIRLTKTTFTATNKKVKMELTGAIVAGESV